MKTPSLDNHNENISSSEFLYNELDARKRAEKLIQAEPNSWFTGTVRKVETLESGETAVYCKVDGTDKDCVRILPDIPSPRNIQEGDRAVLKLIQKKHFSKNKYHGFHLLDTVVLEKDEWGPPFGPYIFISLESVLKGLNEDMSPVYRFMKATQEDVESTIKKPFWKRKK